MRIEFGGAELFAQLQPLWEALFDHHHSVGAAGLAEIPREQSWPLRRAHYERLFAEHPWAGIWLVRDDQERPIGYALAWEAELDFRRAVVIETLSLLPRARGAGIGGELMRLAEAAARDRGAELGVIDVMGGNVRARELYLRRGYVPYSETWMRSQPPSGSGELRISDPSLVKLAADNGFELEFLAGPDDSWVSSERLALLTPLDAEWTRSVEDLTLVFAALQSSGLWTVLVEIPMPPRARQLRETLIAADFKLSMERVVKELDD